MITADEILAHLVSVYGRPGWWSDDPYRVMVQSVLVQNTSWPSVVKVSEAMGDGMTPERILSLTSEELEEEIRPCGFCRAKGAAIRRLTEWYWTYGYDMSEVEKVPTDVLRNELLALKGIGEETADVILLYGFRRPRFVVDAYTRRFMTRLGFDLNDEGIRRFFTEGLGEDHEAFGLFHRLILEHGIARCGKRASCEGCVFEKVCRLREFGI